MREHTGTVDIVRHNAVMGRTEQAARWFRVSDPRPFAQFDASVCISYLAAGSRRQATLWVYSGNLEYLTVEADGRVLYDSRADVPCDMAKWEEAAGQFPEPAVTVTHE